MRGTIAAIEEHYNKNEATCDKQIAANVLRVVHSKIA